MEVRSPIKTLDVADAEWLAHRYDPAHDAIHFRCVTRADHRIATFLTDDELPAGEPVVVARAKLPAAAMPAAPLHFVFHSAFCGSTLLARALDIEGCAMTLKEPVILNDIVGWRHRGGDPRHVATVLDQALRLLARPFAPDEAVIVKPSNVANTYIPAILQMRPQARALFLHAPLDTYIGSIARKGLWGRRWVRDLLIKLLRDDAIDLGIAGDEYLELTDLQVAAVGWLAQHRIFARAIARDDRTARSLDSERLVARPRDALAALATHFDIKIGGQSIDDIINGPAFNRHSKTGAAFGRAERDAERSALEAAHADEIGKVLVWARAVADSAGVALTLPAPLIG